MRGAPVPSDTKATRCLRFGGALVPRGARDSRAGALMETPAEPPHAGGRAERGVSVTLATSSRGTKPGQVRGQTCPSRAWSRDTRAQDSPFLHRSTPHSKKGTRELKPPKSAGWERGEDQGSWCCQQARRAGSGRCQVGGRGAERVGTAGGLSRVRTRPKAGQPSGSGCHCQAACQGPCWHLEDGPRSCQRFRTSVTFVCCF